MQPYWPSASSGNRGSLCTGHAMRPNSRLCGYFKEHLGEEMQHVGQLSLICSWLKKVTLLWATYKTCGFWALTISPPYHSAIQTLAAIPELSHVANGCAHAHNTHLSFSFSTLSTFQGDQLRSSDLSCHPFMCLSVLRSTTPSILGSICIHNCKTTS